MPFQPPPRLPTAAASVLAAGLMLTVASCSHLTPLGPDPATALPQPHHLRSPLVLQAVRVPQSAPVGGCPAGYVTLPGDGSPGMCYRTTGTLVTITSAAVSPVSPFRPPPPPGQQAVPVQRRHLSSHHQRCRPYLGPRRLRDTVHRPAARSRSAQQESSSPASAHTGRVWLKEARSIMVYLGGPIGPRRRRGIYLHDPPPGYHPPRPRLPLKDRQQQALGQLGGGPLGSMAGALRPPRRWPHLS
jgi:hypothetical protein